MRRRQQRQILELLKTLDEVLIEMRRFILAENMPALFALLSDACEFAGHIKDYIDGIKGDGTETAALIDGLSADFAAVSEGINKGSSPEAGFEKRIAHTLSGIKKNVYTELAPDRIEAVFLPYMASMADSLESIYIAAANDPLCDAFWVPIPFYDCNPDRSPGRLHYDGHKYPASLQAIDWRKYDLEARRPDIIFAHAPYDENNFTTCVHPDFHFKRLCELTDMLVYIPYFVCVDDVQEHFCVLPGTIYADKVIVQSEKIRQTYIRVFKRWAKQSGITKNHPLWSKIARPAEKFVALGSPKFDAVINADAEGFTLPDRWRELTVITAVQEKRGLSRSGGEQKKKKIVLFNTGFTNLHEGVENKIAKLKSVLEYFKNQDEVVLWWRPHPLNMECLMSMRPQYLNEYTQIVDSYKREGWGIYDESADVHRAIAISDAYYGDWSSLVSLYQVTGKPIMIGNVELTSNEITLPEIYPTCLYVTGDDIWVVDRSINALFRMSKGDWSLEYAASLSKECGGEFQLGAPLFHTRADESNGFMYFPSFHGDEILICNMCENTIERVCYRDKKGKEEKKDYSRNARDFVGVAALDKYTFFTPCMYPAIMRLDNRTKAVSFFTDWVEPLKKLTKDKLEAFFVFPVVVDKSMWLASCRANAVVKFDMTTCESVVYEVGKKDYCYSGICFDGENFWLSPRYNTPLVKWNPRTGIIKEFFGLFLKNRRQLLIVYNAGYVWLLPRSEDRIIKINTLTDSVCIADGFEGSDEGEKDESAQPIVKYYFAQAFGDSIYTFSEQRRTLIEYNCVTNNRREDVIKYSPEAVATLKSRVTQSFYRDLSTMKTERDCYYYEDSITQLYNLIDFVAQENHNKEAAIMNRRIEIVQSINAHADGTAGQNIYEHAKKYIYDQEAT